MCSQCGAENRADAKFCGECGTALGQLPYERLGKDIATMSQIRVRRDSPAPENLDGERKTVTALFADIKGSTELMEDLDPEEARAIIDPALKLMIEAVHRYDGYVVQSTGDGIFALFGAPVAHEDHPQRALYAALRMQEELRRYADRMRARRRQLPIAGARRRQHRRSGGALDSDRRRADRIHADRAYDQSGLADADRWRRPVRSRSAKQTRKLCEGYFELQAAGADAGSKASASRSTFTK